MAFGVAASLMYQQDASPVVSVVIPTYNRAPLLQMAIASIQEQSFTDWEILVVDDGSTDTTRAMVEELAVRDKRIRYHHQPHSGKPAVGHNLALAQARGRYYCKQDDDDISHSRRLGQCVAYMASHPDIALLATPEGALDDPAMPARADAPRFFRMDMLHALDGWRAFFPTNEDRDLMLRAQQKGYAMATLPERLYHHRTLADDQVTRRPILLACLALVDFCYVLRAAGLPDIVQQGHSFTHSIAMLKDRQPYLPQGLLALCPDMFGPGGELRAIRDWRHWLIRNLDWHYQHHYTKAVGKTMAHIWQRSGHLQFRLWARIYCILSLGWTASHMWMKQRRVSGQS